MADIKKLLGSGKEYELFGEKVELSPLKVKNMDLLFDLNNDTKKAEAMKKLIRFYGKQIFKDATDEELDNLGFDAVNPMMECILDINGLSNADKE